MKDPEYRARYNQRQRNHRYKDKYGVSAEVVDQMALDQGYRCLICRRKTKLCVDHERQSGVIRGLLCNTCNLGLGHFKDNPVLLRGAIRYLMRNHEDR